MKKLIHLLKPLSFLPAILMILLIYSFSAQNGEVSGNLSYHISYKIMELKSEIRHEYKSQEELAAEATAIEFYVRKAAHMTEYFLLAACIAFPLYVYGIRGVRMVLLTLFLCVIAAGFDEFHQSFVAGRGPSLRDVLIDTSGSLVSVILIQAFCWSVSHQPGKKNRR